MSNKSYVSLIEDGNKIQFYIYKITDKNGRVVKIVDSEALAILYTED